MYINTLIWMHSIKKGVIEDVWMSQNMFIYEKWCILIFFVKNDEQLVSISKILSCFVGHLWVSAVLCKLINPLQFRVWKETFRYWRIPAVSPGIHVYLIYKNIYKNYNAKKKNEKR